MVTNRHMSTSTRGKKAKVWLHEVRVARSSGFGDVELGRIVKIVSDNRTRLLEAWNDFFA